MQVVTYTQDIETELLLMATMMTVQFSYSLMSLTKVFHQPFVPECFYCSGIDLLSFEPELNTLRVVEAKKFNVSWYIYTHESRMVLLASGMQCTIFYGFQVFQT